MADRRSPAFMAALLASMFDNKEDVKLGNFRNRKSKCYEISKIIFKSVLHTSRKKVYERWRRNFGGVQQLFELEKMKANSFSDRPLTNTIDDGHVAFSACETNEVKPDEGDDRGDLGDAQVVVFDRSLKDMIAMAAMGSQEMKREKESGASEAETLTASESSSVCETDTSSELGLESQEANVVTKEQAKVETTTSRQEEEVIKGVEDVIDCINIRDKSTARNQSMDKWPDKSVGRAKQARKPKRHIKKLFPTTSCGLRFDGCNIVLASGIFRFDVANLFLSSEKTNFFLHSLMDKFVDPCATQIKSKKHHSSHLSVYSYCKLNRCRIFICRLFVSSPTRIEILSSSETPSHPEVKFRRVYGGISRAKLSKHLRAVWNSDDLDCHPSTPGVGCLQGAKQPSFLRSRIVQESVLKYDGWLNK